MWLWFRPMTPKRTGFSPEAAMNKVYHAQCFAEKAEDSVGVGLGFGRKGLHVAGAGHDPQLGSGILGGGQQAAAVLGWNARIGVAVNEQNRTRCDACDGLLGRDGVQIDAIEPTADKGDARRKHRG